MSRASTNRLLDHPDDDRARATQGDSGPLRPPSLKASVQNPPPPFALRSLGGLSVVRRGRRIPDRLWHGQVSRRLLMRLLAADGRPLMRERIEFDLWPDAESEAGRNNLSVALHRLRGALEPKGQRRCQGELLQVERDRIGLGPRAIEAWDVTHLRDAIARAEEATSKRREPDVVCAAQQARASVEQDFLPESYDEWTFEFQRSLDVWLVDRATKLASHWFREGGFDAAMAFARVALCRLRSHEPSWACLVRAQIAVGDRASAHRSLEEASDQIRRELGIEPSAELKQLAEQIIRPKSRRNAFTPVPKTHPTARNSPISKVA